MTVSFPGPSKTPNYDNIQVVNVQVKFSQISYEKKTPNRPQGVILTL